jgi:hypothetical protein
VVISSGQYFQSSATTYYIEDNRFLMLVVNTPLFFYQAGISPKLVTLTDYSHAIVPSLPCTPAGWELKTDEQNVLWANFALEML